MKIEYQAIGYIKTPFKEKHGMPIQPAGGRGVKGTVELLEKYADGLKDLEGFSHIYLIYHLHQSEGYDLHVIPFMDDVHRGLFATRAPRRPNPIGISLVRLVGIRGNSLEIEDLDMLDGTPLLDIKPYTPRFDERKDTRSGWLKNNNDVEDMRSDGRF
ncbi:MAG: tRNA (N6-threonylcarbamoyladenosine(37)-N6)-methyltransferase TrmO [Bacteroidales bacterium]|nr:tRNA (N6-threonylcarbamoyladenosine(37)-N6)-methyltransferase TrmO [Bacteroidales bacterium]MCF8346225.1 tRNA (N6-threonylcarbamoyladenosine(37)-N6)-methyltransferase TrmO [Bacteroidales bacterium]MCF8376626.1 tRNA (N6-threonylcarbamoyladenosine(37)-N6)-methyltransferase TrmO [Bacteroidales bacterium]MCF8400652.1 tRNA (N6-threonylcarbamoyladenosine(37)-N6)-methyltransferase TrmO [Bacteroidales bacterium]